MAWNFRRDPICKAQVPIQPSATTTYGNIGAGCIVARTSNHGYTLTSTAIVGSSAGSTAASLHVVEGICVVASTAGSSDLTYVARVTPYDEMVIPWSTAVSSTYITSSNIGCYLRLYDTSNINGSTGFTVPTYSSDVATVLCLTGFSTQEDVVYGYIPADIVS
jgi:hypothetical protein